MFVNARKEEIWLDYLKRKYQNKEK
jgi:hypothetical protein